MPPKTKFQEGEKVLCFHGPLLYEAKCVKCEVKDKQVRYHIHYNGWNKNWDEWVPESRVLKCNEAGLQKQKELMKAHGVQQSQMGKKEISAASKTVHTCTKCKKDFLTEGRLKKHRCSACESCGKVLSSYQRLLGHSCQQQDDDNNDEYSIESDDEKSDSNKSIRSLVQNQDVAK